jgi:AcrR family transcriptional regulator
MARPKGPTLTQKDIVAAAIAVLHKDGQAALGVNRVARELGIQPPSMYNHVSGNDALYRLVALEGWRRFLDYARRDVAQATDSRSILRAAAFSYRDCAQQHPELLAIASSHAMSLDDTEFVVIFQEILDIYRTALAPMGLSPDQIVHAARMLNAAFFGFAQAEKARIFLMPQSLDDSYEWMVTTLIAALEQKYSPP